MRVGTHATLGLGRQLRQLGFKSAVALEQFLRVVALHPAFEDFYVFGLLVHFAQGDLVRAPGVFGAFSVDYLGAGPAFGRAQNDHGPTRSLDRTVAARDILDALDLLEGSIERSSHE